MKASVLDAHGAMLADHVRVETPVGSPPAALIRALVRLIRSLPAFDRISVARVSNDVALQGLGAIARKGVELVVTLGTGVGSALYLEGLLVPQFAIGAHTFRKGDVQRPAQPGRPGARRDEEVEQPARPGGRDPTRPRPLRPPLRRREDAKKIAAARRPHDRHLTRPGFAVGSSSGAAGRRPSEGPGWAGCSRWAPGCMAG